MQAALLQHVPLAWIPSPQSSAAGDAGGEPHARTVPLHADIATQSARFQIPNELLQDPVGYFRTSYDSFPGTYPEM